MFDGVLSLYSRRYSKSHQQDRTFLLLNLVNIFILQVKCLLTDQYGFWNVQISFPSWPLWISTVKQQRYLPNKKKDTSKAIIELPNNTNYTASRQITLRPEQKTIDQS